MENERSENIVNYDVKFRHGAIAPRLFSLAFRSRRGLSTRNCRRRLDAHPVERKTCKLGHAANPSRESLTRGSSGGRSVDCKPSARVINSSALWMNPKITARKSWTERLSIGNLLWQAVSRLADCSIQSRCAKDSRLVKQRPRKWQAEFRTERYRTGHFHGKCSVSQVAACSIKSQRAKNSHLVLNKGRHRVCVIN